MQWPTPELIEFLGPFIAIAVKVGITAILIAFFLPFIFGNFLFILLKKKFIDTFRIDAEDPVEEFFESVLSPDIKEQLGEQAYALGRLANRLLLLWRFKPEPSWGAAIYRLLHELLGWVLTYVLLPYWRLMFRHWYAAVPGQLFGTIDLLLDINAFDGITSDLVNSGGAEAIGQKITENVDTWVNSEQKQDEKWQIIRKTLKVLLSVPIFWILWSLPGILMLFLLILIWI